MNETYFGNTQEDSGFYLQTFGKMLLVVDELKLLFVDVQHYYENNKLEILINYTKPVTVKQEGSLICIFYAGKKVIMLESTFKHPPYMVRLIKALVAEEKGNE